MDRVLVPLRPDILSDRLPVIGLVGYYPANYLVGRTPLLERKNVSPTYFHFVGRIEI